MGAGWRLECDGTRVDRVDLKRKADAQSVRIHSDQDLPDRSSTEENDDVRLPSTPSGHPRLRHSPHCVPEGDGCCPRPRRRISCVCNPVDGMREDRLHARGNGTAPPCRRHGCLVRQGGKPRPHVRFAWYRQGRVSGNTLLQAEGRPGRREAIPLDPAQRLWV